MRSGAASYIGASVHVAIGRKRTVLSAPERIYLDHAATTPVLPEARAAVAAAMEGWANPSSPHGDGRRARASLEQARKTIAEALDWPHDVIFTSGASEGIQIAATRAKAERRIVSAVEHESVFAATGEQATVLPVDANGLVDLAELDKTLAGDSALVAIQLVNNETGVIQPIEQIHAMVRTADSLLLADCAQAAGKIALPEADFVAVSAHKFGGPPGVGALLVRDLATLHPSGGQERGYRRGTENWPGVAGMARALDTRAYVDAMPRLMSLRDALDREIFAAGGIVIAADAPRAASIGAYGMPGVASASQLVQLDLAGISVSAGSACSSGSLRPSRVLSAMGLPAETVGSVIRVSFGPATSEEQIDRFLTEWRRIQSRANRAAA